MIQEIYATPCDISWFQAQLDRLCSRYVGRVRLRVAWAPQLVETLATDARGNTLQFKKYPVLDGYFDEWIEGYAYVRNGVGVAYQKNGDSLTPPGVKITDIAVADYRRINPSVHLFVIEKLVDEESATSDAADKRRMSLQELGFDIFAAERSGERWDFLSFISEHRDGCCDLAADREIQCHGLYRPPDSRDVERVREGLRQMEASGVLRDGDRTDLIERRATETAQTIDRLRNLELIDVLKEVQEEARLDEIAQTRSRVTGGVNPPLHRKPY